MEPVNESFNTSWYANLYLLASENRLNLTYSKEWDRIKQNDTVFAIVFSEIFSAVSRTINITEWYYLKYNTYGVYGPYTKS